MLYLVVIMVKCTRFKNKHKTTQKLCEHVFDANIVDTHVRKVSTDVYVTMWLKMYKVTISTTHINNRYSNMLVKFYWTIKRFSNTWKKKHLKLYLVNKFIHTSIIIDYFHIFLGSGHFPYLHFFSLLSSLSPL